MTDINEVMAEAIEIAVDFIKEQECCHYCVHNGVRGDCAHTDEYCRDGIYHGLLKIAEERLKGRKEDESINRTGLH